MTSQIFGNDGKETRCYREIVYHARIGLPLSSKFFDGSSLFLIGSVLPNIRYLIKNIRRKGFPFFFISFSCAGKFVKILMQQCFKLFLAVQRSSHTNHGEFLRHPFVKKKIV